MKFIGCESTKINNRLTAAPAVIPKRAFTIIEVLVVVVIIGILSSLAFSSMVDLIFSNRAKETAQTMRTFVERAVAEGKRQGKTIKIELDGNSIVYSLENSNGKFTTIANSEALSGSFSANNDSPPDSDCIALSNIENFNEGVEAKPTIGISGITSEGYFVACGSRNYCSAAVKTKDLNSFVACIRRGSTASWERL